VAPKPKEDEMNALVVISIAVVAIIWVVSIVDIVRRRMDAKHTAAWVLLVVVLPVLGSFIYWVQRPATPEEVEQTVGAQADLRRERGARRAGDTRLY
jgi:uncharacterized membrane protein YhaH (DUF805 family)